MDYVPTNVLIVHPKSFAAEVLAHALSRLSQYKVLNLVSSCNDLHGVLESSKVDVMLISHKMLQASPDGLGAIKDFRLEFPNLKTVLLLEERTPNAVIEGFRSGAKGVFCIASGEIESLCRCVDSVHAGNIWASNEEIKWVMEALESTGTYTVRGNIVNSNGIRLLSEREQTVVVLLSEGMSNRDIATQLQLSETTVKNYLFRIFDKLGVSTRTELLLYAMKNSENHAERPAAPALRPAPVVTLPRRKSVNDVPVLSMQRIQAQQSWS